MNICLSPIGFVKGGRAANFDDNWGSNESIIEESIIEVSQSFPAESLTGLGEFSHARIVYSFDRVLPEKIETAARNPRNNPKWPKVGIFAQRGKNRPNRLGVPTCRILRIDGHNVVVQGPGCFGWNPGPRN